MRAFYIGRFQPYHLGHQAILQQIAERADEVAVAIGSAQRSHTLDDPFTAGERMMMVVDSLKGVIPIPFYVIPLEDVERNSVWVSNVKSMTPPFDAAYSNNPLVARLFREAGVKVRHSPLYKRNEYSGTEIRRRMVAGEKWEHLVPKAVVRILREVRGVQRLKDLAKGDQE
ncbi:MAG: nicotinamide-nucleotide adenylyltransferase [Halobacteria archaeon]